MTAPPTYEAILTATLATGFEMASDRGTCELLGVLASSKPRGRCLELGTGSGLSTAWLLAGIADDATLVSIDNDPGLLRIAREHLGADPRLELVEADGGEWLDAFDGARFDFVFADTWAGKYHHLDQALGLLKPGGLYVIDDMRERPNWPQGHAAKAAALLEHLARRADLAFVSLDCCTGIGIGVAA